MDSKGIFKNSSTWTHRHRKSWIGSSGLSDGKAEAPWQLRMFIKYSYSRRLGYYIQLNEETELLQTAKQEAGMANPGGRSLWREQSSTVNIWGEEATWTFLHTLSAFTWDLRKALSVSWGWGTGTLLWPCPMQQHKRAQEITHLRFPLLPTLHHPSSLTYSNQSDFLHA